MIADVPAMVNAHSHAFQRDLRGAGERPSSPEDDFWSWRTAMFALAGALDPDRMRDVASRVYGEMAAALANRFERRWMRGDQRQADDMLDSPHASSLADFTVSYQTVERMRVVPFDRRSFIELFSASATPFAPLAFLLELPEKFRALVSLLGG